MSQGLPDEATALPLQARAILMSACQGARCIRAWSDTLRALSPIAAVEAMEACWAIRNEYSSRETFDAFVRTHVRVLSANRAWLMAQTWDAARYHRELLALARSRPQDAIEFVHAFVAAGAEDLLRRPGDTDPETAELLRLPRRKRRAQLRALLDRPGDSPQRTTSDAASRTPETAASPVDELQEIERRLDALSQRFMKVQVSQTERQKAEGLSALAMMALERIGESLARHVS